MTVDAPEQFTRSAAGRGGVRALATGVAVASALGLSAIVFVAISSTTGQLVDDAAMKAVTATNAAEDTVLSALGRVSLGAILAVAFVCVLIALLRRRLALALGALTVIAGANVTTQVLKAALQRPDLGLGAHNSLPSGHTTVVVSALAALLLVLPTVFRPVMAVVGTAAVAVTGLSTIVAGWHRPADVVAAYLVVLMWAGLVSAMAGGRRTRRGIWLLSSFAALLGSLGSVVFLVGIGVRPASAWVDAVLATTVLGIVALLAGIIVTVMTVISPAHD